MKNIIAIKVINQLLSYKKNEKKIKRKKISLTTTRTMNNHEPTLTATLTATLTEIDSRDLYFIVSY